VKDENLNSCNNAAAKEATNKKPIANMKVIKMSRKETND